MSKVRTIKGSRTKKGKGSAKTVFEAQQENDLEPLQLEEVSFNPSTIQLYLNSLPSLGDSTWMDILKNHNSLNPEMTRTMILICLNLLKKIIDDFEIKHSFVNGILKFQTADGDWSSDIDIASMVDAKITAADIPGQISAAITAQNIPGQVNTAIIAADIPGLVSAEVAAQMP